MVHQGKDAGCDPEPENSRKHRDTRVSHSVFVSECQCSHVCGQTRFPTGMRGTLLVNQASSSGDIKGN